MTKSSLKKPIIIIGGGGHAKVVLEVIELNNGKVKGYTDLKKTDLDAAYLGHDQVIESFKPSQVNLALGIASIGVPNVRQKVFERFSSLGYQFVSLIHPKAIVSSKASLAQGVQVMAGAIINPSAQIGRNVIINTAGVVEHDCKIGEHTHVAPRTVLSGGGEIGACCHIGAGSTVIQGIKIGDQVVVAAGAVVVDHIQANQVVVGVPARIKGKD